MLHDEPRANNLLGFGTLPTIRHRRCCCNRVYRGDVILVSAKDLYVDCAPDLIPHSPPPQIGVGFRVGGAGDQTTNGFTAGTNKINEDAHDHIGVIYKVATFAYEE